jgi:dTDP-4-dehydrorhamnose reductase
MKVAIIGANGQLGMDLMAVYADSQPVGLTHEDIEISNLDSVSGVLGSISPSLVINTAAYHKVDDCEKNPARSFEVNALGAANLAKISESQGFDLVHVSTDYVFDGLKGKPYVESDMPNPLNMYAVTKVAGEHLVAANASRHYIVRSSGLYGHNRCRAKGRNFIDTMLAFAKEKPEIRVVEDEILTPTYTYHLAIQIRELASTHAYGLYHATNQGQCSWYEFAQAIFEFAGLKPNLLPTTVKNFASPIKRPSYSVLENAGLKKLGVDHLPPWRESLKHYFDHRPSVAS